MDAALKTQAEKLACDMATQATTVDDLNGLLRTMIKSALERMLNTEMDVHLGRRALPVASDGAVSLSDAAPSLDSPASSKKSPQRTFPQDGQRRYGRHRPANAPRSQRHLRTALIAKHQRRLPGFDDKILALYAKSMTTRDIQDIVKELYGVDVSARPSTCGRRCP